MSMASRILPALVMLLVFTLQTASAGAGSSVLHEKASAYGTVVVTDEGDGLRALRFGRDGVRQSLVRPGDPEYLGLAYVPVVLAGLALSHQQRRFLVIGLGGGTMPAFLRRHYPAAEIDAVDINPEVVFAAKNFLGFREDARLRVHITDGRRFIESVQQPYDAIILDAYGADAVPAHLTTREFLGAVRRAVRSDGVVISNLWHTATRPPYDSMVQTYRAGFDQIHVIRVAGTGNRILYALPRNQPLSRAELADLTRKFASAGKFRFNAGALVERGWTAPDNAAFGGQVLSDTDYK